MAQYSVFMQVSVSVRMPLDAEARSPEEAINRAMEAINLDDVLNRTYGPTHMPVSVEYSADALNTMDMFLVDEHPDGLSVEDWHNGKWPGHPVEHCFQLDMYGKLHRIGAANDRGGN